MWDPVTATIDWCEDNYAVWSVVAEFWNTASAFLYVGAGLYGWRVHSSSLRPAERAGFLGIVLVGLGTAAFHTTLKYWAQLLDELPMIYVEAYLVSLHYGPLGKTALWLGAILFTVSYAYYRNPVYHEAVFGALLAFAVYTYSKRMKEVRSEESRRSISRLIKVTLASAALGFALWNVDNLCCAHLRALRSKIPSLFFFELHAWWHFCTAIAAYYFAVGFTALSPSSLKMHNNQPIIRYRYGVAPVIVFPKAK